MVGDDDINDEVRAPCFWILFVDGAGANPSTLLLVDARAAAADTRVATFGIMIDCKLGRLV